MFFHGTKLRYFEVMAGASLAVDVTNAAACSDVEDVNNKVGSDEEGYSVTTGVPSISMLPQHGPKPVESQCLHQTNLKTMKYFHYFLTTTSLSLPQDSTTTQYWQTETVGLVLQRRWLMCDFLALSACQLALSTEDIESGQKHSGNLEKYVSAFHFWMRAKEQVDDAGVRVKALLCLTTWAMRNRESSEFSLNPLKVASHSIYALMVAIKEIHMQAGTPLPDAHTGSFRPQHSASLTRLQTLPSRMAEAFGRPDPKDIPEVLAAVSACSALWIPSDTEAASEVWKCMALWTAKVSGPFSDIVARQNPAAMVVIAH
jgi:hypothetical protein